MKAFGAAVFVVCWSSGFVGATFAERSAPPATLLAWRYVVTTVLLVGCCLLVRRLRHAWRGVSTGDIARQALVGLLAHGVFLGAVFAAAVQDVDSGTTALVCSLQPMLVAALSRVIWGDRLTTWQVAGLVLGIGGVAVSVGGVGTVGIVNVWLPVVALVGLSLSAVLERAFRPTVPIAVGLTIQVAAATVAFVVVALFTSGAAMDVTPTVMGALAWLVILPGLIGYASLNWCLRHLGPADTSTLLYLTPAVTLFWAWAVFAEQPAGTQWIGLGIVLTGVLLALGTPRVRPGGRVRTHARIGSVTDERSW